MNLLDENFPDDARLLLQKWGIHVRQVGRDVGDSGAADDVLFPLMHRLRNVTFFTHDQDFFKRHFCHPAYCLVLLDVDEDHMATCARRFLRLRAFATTAHRMGVVARVNVEGVQYWRVGQPTKTILRWPKVAVKVPKFHGPI